MSTIADAVSSDYALSVHMQRGVAIGMSRNPDLCEQVAELPWDPDPGLMVADESGAPLANGLTRDERVILDRAVEEAKTRARLDAKAEYGTLVHALANHEEMADPGSLEFYSDALVDNAQVQAWLERHDVVMQEVFVAHPHLHIAGTLDLVAEIPGYGRLVGDLKTGRLLAKKHQIQITGYAASTVFDEGGWGGNLMEQYGVSQEYGFILHLPARSARLSCYVIPLDHARLHRAVAEHGSANPKLDRQDEDVESWLLNRLPGATLVEARRWWRTYRPIWTDQMTDIVSGIQPDTSTEEPTTPSSEESGAEEVRNT